MMKKMYRVLIEEYDEEVMRRMSRKALDPGLGVQPGFSKYDAPRCFIPIINISM